MCFINPAAYQQWAAAWEQHQSKVPYSKMPQELADALAHEAQLAVAWFHNSETMLPAVMTKGEITDDQVRDRIQGFQYAMDRELARIHRIQYDDGWAWRFDDDWRTKHRKWVEAYVAWEKEANPETSRRYDLSALPWTMQRALCTRWQRIWEEWEEKGYSPGR